MKKYRYVEFIDGYWGANAKSGELWINTKEPGKYVEEFSLKQCVRGYYTTLEHMGELGWELIFVTPCGYINEGTGMLQNAYIFKKEIEE